MVRRLNRRIAQAPAFAAASGAIVLLGVGVGGALLSLLDAASMRSLDVGRVDELVLITARPKPPATHGSLPFDFASETIGNGIAASLPAGVNVTLDNFVERVSGEFVSPRYFDLFHTRAAAGSILRAPDATDTVLRCVISFRFWTKHFGRDVAAIGRPLTINLRSVEIVGVVEPRFSGPSLDGRTDIWFPRSAMFPLLGIEASQVRVPSMLARAEDGPTRAAIAAELRNVALASPDPSIHSATFDVVDGRRGLPANIDLYGDGLAIVMVFGWFVVLIACSAFAILFVARMTAIEPNMAVAIALGIRPYRLVLDVIGEAAAIVLPMAVVGALLGPRLAAVFAWWLDPLSATDWISAVSWRVAASVGGATLLLLLCCAGIAAGWVRTLAPAAVLRSGRNHRPRASTIRRMLAAAQVAASFVLIYEALLAGISLVGLNQADLGFQPRDVTLMTINSQPSGLKGPLLVDAGQQLISRLQKLSGVEAVTAAATTPFGPTTIVAHVSIPRSAKDADGIPPRINAISPGYFASLGMTLVEGRDFQDSDDIGHVPVAILDEELARAYFTEGWRGRHIVISGRDVEVIGVVRGGLSGKLREPIGLAAYVPLWQRPTGTFTLVVRGTRDLSLLERDVRAILAQVLQGCVVYHVTSLRDQINRTIVPERAVAMIGFAFSALAIVTSAAAAFGLTTFVINRRRRDLAVRTALGARPARIVGVISGDLLSTTFVGLALGIGLSIGLARIAGRLLYGVDGVSVTGLLGTAALSLVIVVLGSLLPIRRILKSQPADALRRL